MIAQQDPCLHEHLLLSYLGRIDCERGDMGTTQAWLYVGVEESSFSTVPKDSKLHGNHSPLPVGWLLVWSPPIQSILGRV